jgi:hypothetical protein
LPSRCNACGKKKDEGCTKTETPELARGCSEWYPSFSLAKDIMGDIKYEGGGRISKRD